MLQHAPKLKIIKLNFDTEKDQAKASKATPPIRPKTFDTISNDAVKKEQSKTRVRLNLDQSVPKWCRTSNTSF